MDNMVVNYRTIIKQYKQSRYVPECYLLLGDDFNNKGDLASAKKHYTAVLNYPQSPAIIIARYKLAWCHINEKGFKDAIKLFEQCVLSDTAGDLDIGINGNQLYALFDDGSNFTSSLIFPATPIEPNRSP